MSELNRFKFKHEFRDYQKRALDEVHQYMEDDKIHIVAAPGAGKTILALQLLVEINKNTLILVPTISLREQWITRFSDDFACGEDVSSIISGSLEKDGQIIVTTYQAFHSTFKDDANALAKKLKNLDIELIILDEAHHLKASWWQALDEIISLIKKPKVISLTATPPYDVYNHEWKRYIELCGEIDTEIMTPELVQKGDLCPHQDYVYFNFPTEKQLTVIEGYYEKRTELFEGLCGSKEFLTAIALNLGIIDLESNIDYFLANFEYYISILSFLNYRGIPIDTSLMKSVNIPNFSIGFMELLLTYCIFLDKNSYKDFSDYFKDVKRMLNEIGAIHESKVHLVNNKETKVLITQNIGKLNSINEIIIGEYLSMGEMLKMVVITDYIRDDIDEVMEETEVNVMGAIPIFKSIRNRVKEDVNIAVLTGSVVIIPSIMKDGLLGICEEKNISEIEITELAYDFDYSRVWVSEKVKKYIVAIITELFEKHNIQVLIGTGALIGEGWDAPFVNSLIMASFISSFVTSNQIRGRAIRTSKQDAQKTANIWHLVCLEKIGADEYSLGVDYEIIKKRFDTFEGIYINEDKIGRSVQRLNIQEKTYSHNDIVGINNKTVETATKRDEMKQKWANALVDYVPVRKERISNVDYSIGLRRHRNASLKVSGISVAMFSALSAGSCFYFGLGAQNIIVMSIFAGVTIAGSIKHFLDGKDINVVKKLGKAIVATLVDIKLITNNSKVVVEQEKKDIVFYMKDGSTIEKSRFNNCLMEMISPIDVPRYLVCIKGNYYSVPTLIGRNKKWVQRFRTHLKKEFFKVDVVYTKNAEGKRELLNIKLRSLKGNVGEWNVR